MTVLVLFRAIFMDFKLVSESLLPDSNVISAKQATIDQNSAL